MTQVFRRKTGLFDYDGGRFWEDIKEDFRLASTFDGLLQLAAADG